jgi:peptidoglycan/LPS O-acetylase OafA/YrhL
VHLAAFLFLLTFVRADAITYSSTGLFSRPALMIVNLGLVQSWFPTLTQEFSYNGVSWSISTEMAFYLAFPLLLPRIRKHWGACLALAAGLVASMIGLAALLHLPADGGIEAITTNTLLYSQPLVRGLEFVTGMASYVFWNRFIRHRAMSVWTFTAIEAAALAMVFTWTHRWFWIAQTHFPAWPGLMIWYGEAGSFWAFAIVIVAFASAGGWIGKAISWRPFIWLGEISFSIYMFHQILIKIFALSLPGIASPWTFFPALIALSAASFYSVEGFGRRWLGSLIGASKPSKRVKGA